MDSSTPVALGPAGGSWREISSDSSNPDLSGPCGIHADGSGWCLSSRRSNQTGYAVGLPLIPLPGNKTWASIATGFEVATGVTDTGEGLYWGLPAFFYATPERSPQLHPVPAAPDGAASWKELGGLYDSACGITSKGNLYCLGSTYGSWDKWTPVGHTV
ncbi:hypothetical protein ABPG75_005994 [Micractinium tetrahymenae]